MRRRHLLSVSLPTRWLFTDERMGEALWPALGRLPRGSGIVFRHYSLTDAARRALFLRVRRIARQRGLLLLLAGDARTARRWHADGCHGLAIRRHDAALLVTAPVHDHRQIARAERGGADALFLSPVFATRSHPGGRTLGSYRFAMLARGTTLPVIALGGMSAHRMRQLQTLGAAGYAAIDGWLRP